MSIVGMTDRPAGFPRLGIVRKGKPKPANGKTPGADSDQFELRDAPLIAEAYQVYGPEPVRQLNVVLAYDDLDRVFSCWREIWGKSGLHHRCDGAIVHWQADVQGKLEHVAEKQMPCPLTACKPVGRLEFFVREIMRLGTHSLITTSKHDILRLSEQLRGISLSNGGDGTNRLFGIPCLLTRAPQKISVPKEDGRVKVTKWLVSIEADPAWVEAKLALLGARPDALELPAPDDEAEEANGGNGGEPAPTAEKSPEAPPEKSPEERWRDYLKASGATRLHIHAALGTEKVSFWLAADDGRTIDDAIGLVQQQVDF